MSVKLTRDEIMAEMDRHRLREDRRMAAVNGAESYQAMCEQIASDEHDGHLTLLRFTTGWKAMFGTCNPDDSDRGYLWAIKSADTSEEAFKFLLFREQIITMAESYQFDVMGVI